MRAAHNGFTLLEVMIAVAILGLSLTAIFASEVGAVQAVHRSRYLDQATLLARCKMGELEELVEQEGLPAIEKSGEDACCEHGEVEGYECKWIIERVILPEFGEEVDSDSEFADDDDDSGGDPLASLTDELGSVDDIMTSGVGDGLTSLALQLGYPIIKPSIEEQVRRATITIEWPEGKTKRSFDLIQFMVAHQPIPVDDETAAGDPSSASSAGSSTTPATTPSARGGTGTTP